MQMNPEKLDQVIFFQKLFVILRLIMSTADDQALIQDVLLFFSSIFQIKSSCVGKRGTLFFMPSCTNRVMEFKMPMKGPNHLLLLFVYNQVTIFIENKFR